MDLCSLVPRHLTHICIAWVSGNKEIRMNEAADRLAACHFLRLKQISS